MDMYLARSIFFFVFYIDEKIYKGMISSLSAKSIMQYNRCAFTMQSNDSSSHCQNHAASLNRAIHNIYSISIKRTNQHRDCSFSHKEQQPIN